MSSRENCGTDEAHVVADVFTMLVRCSSSLKLARSLSKQLTRRFGSIALNDAKEITQLLTDGEWKVTIIRQVCDAIGIVFENTSFETFRQNPKDFSFMPPDVLSINPVVVTQCHVDLVRGEFVVLLSLSLSL